MIIDSMLYLANAQAVTATGDTASTNVYDTGMTADDGIGEPIFVNCLVTTTPTSGGAATIQAVLQTSADNSTWTDVLLGPALAYNAAGAAAGQYLLQSRLPLGIKRYVRIAWRVGTAVLTAGNFSAFITKDIQQAPTNPVNFTVL